MTLYFCTGAAGAATSAVPAVQRSEGKALTAAQGITPDGICLELMLNRLWHYMRLSDSAGAACSACPPTGRASDGSWPLRLVRSPERRDVYFYGASCGTP
jgi:hypothetical protein